MAVNIFQTISYSVAQAVSDRLAAFQTSRQELQLADETAFYQSINDKGMSFEDQLSFRQGQLEREQQRAVPDQNYIRSLKKDISDLKKQVSMTRLKAAYLDSFTKLKTGMEDWTTHIQFLKDQLAVAADPDQVDLLKGYLSDAQQGQYQYEQQISDNYYQYALNDKTVSILQKGIADATKEKSKALGGGDKLRASALDLKIQSLNKTLNEVQISDTIHQFDLKKLKAYNPQEVLDTLQEKITSADSSTPVTVGGQTYTSAKDFWQSYQAQYFNGGEFDKAMSQYYADVFQIAQNQSTEAYPTKVGAIKLELDKLLQRPDLTEYKLSVQGTIANILAVGSQKAADMIIDKAVTNHTFQDATNKLSKLQSDTGVDQTPNYNKLIGAIADVKTGEVQKYLGIVQQEINNGKSPQQALNAANTAYNQGKINTPSPEEMANKPVSQIGSETTLGTGSPNNKTTVSTPTNLQTFNEGDVIKTANSPTVYKYENGVLRPIYSPPTATEQQFINTLGKSYKDIKIVNDVAGMPMGQQLDLPAPPAKVVKLKSGQTYGQYAPQTLFAEEGTVMRPFSSWEVYQRLAGSVQPTEVDSSYFNDKTIGTAL